ncbi:MAG: ferric reductase-like transmembrane domain-containing protein [Anaerolineales bacterium]
MTIGVFLPNWLPDLTTSVLGSQPKVYWYLSRGSALVAFILLWFSMGFGTLITNKLARLWPGGPRAFDLHEYFSLLGLGFALFHAMILLGDKYTNYNPFQILVPFASTPYRQFWVGLGQIGFYVWFLVTVTFYLRKRITKNSWRTIHLLSYGSFILALVHGIASGTDSGASWIQAMYWVAGSSLLFMFFYRLMAAVFKVKKERRVPSTTVK